MKTAFEWYLLGSCQRGQIVTVLWEGGFEVPPALSAPLVAAKLLVLTVIGTVVIRAKADWGGGEGDGNGGT